MKALAETLTVKGLALRAGGQGRVLCSDLGLAVQPRECWVLLGPNGAGKSTLLATLAGLLLPPQGHVRLDDRDLAHWPLDALARERAWCAPHWSDPFPASVAETVQLARPAAQQTQAAHVTTSAATTLPALLERFDIAHLAAADVRTLSGGERQRVALASAWWQGAPLLLLDEPASHLDLLHRELLVALLREHAEGGGSAVVSVHDLDLAWRMASHAVLLDGRGGAVVGERDAVLVPEHLAAAFGVPVSWVEVCGQRRFWIGSTEAMHA
jgi:iron complex transport system ATP-binding protein